MKSVILGAFGGVVFVFFKSNAACTVFAFVCSCLFVCLFTVDPNPSCGVHTPHLSWECAASDYVGNFGHFVAFAFCGF